MHTIELDNSVTKKLLDWYRRNARDLPWRQDQDPYRVWLSEIMLQQTRVDTVIPYYERFLREVPDIAALAALDEQRLLKLWEGLGYYSRARNLQKAARVVTEQYGGIFPQTFDEIRKLPGVGDYTAGAIASISFDLPTPAVDGNVMRVVARLTQTAEIDAPAMKKQVAAALAERYPQRGCGDFTQALMELGAVRCLPGGLPLCTVCPLKDLCAAHRAGRETDYPAKKEKAARRQERMTVLVLQAGDATALQQRPPDGLLGGMWQLPHTAGALAPDDALALAAQWGTAPVEIGKAYERKHIFTHIEWHMRCYRAICGSRAPGFVWADAEQLDDTYALPTAFKKCLK